VPTCFFLSVFWVQSTIYHLLHRVSDFSFAFCFLCDPFFSFPVRCNLFFSEGTRVESFPWVASGYRTSSGGCEWLQPMARRPHVTRELISRKIIRTLIFTNNFKRKLFPLDHQGLGCTQAASELLHAYKLLRRQWRTSSAKLFINVLL
jgi:hypothetical protein